MLRKMTSKLTPSSTIKLNSGYEIPRLGYGVYQIQKEEVKGLCQQALSAGYRLIDTATAYRNQGPSGQSIAASDIPRSDVFFGTKVPIRGKPLGYKNVLELVDAALAETQLDYLDLVLIHWPYGGSDSRRGAWRALVESVEAGKVRSIGVSNYGIHHLNELEGHIKELEAERGGPGTGGVISVGQWEIHPWMPRDDIVDWCRKRNIVLEAFSPIVRGTRWGESRLKALADKYGKTEAQILLRWNLQKGYIPLVKSAQPERVLENIGCFDFELTDAEVDHLTTDEYSPCTWDPSVEPLEK